MILLVQKYVYGIIINEQNPKILLLLVIRSALIILGTLYLFGGWNGTEDLDDLWSFCTTSERWTLLCRHSSLAYGPSPRSCHKMVFDPVYRKLYTLGRYLDNAQRIPSNMNVSKSILNYVKPVCEY